MAIKRKHKPPARKTVLCERDSSKRSGKCHAGQITAVVDTHQARREDLAGTLPTPQRDVLNFNNSRTDTISACLRSLYILVDTTTIKQSEEKKNKARNI